MDKILENGPLLVSFVALLISWRTMIKKSDSEKIRQIDRLSDLSNEYETQIQEIQNLDTKGSSEKAINFKEKLISEGRLNQNRIENYTERKSISPIKLAREVNKETKTLGRFIYNKEILIANLNKESQSNNSTYYEDLLDFFGF